MIKNFSENITKIAKNSTESFYYAKYLKFKNVPEIILESIAEDPVYCYDFVRILHFRNIPHIILKKFANQGLNSHIYAYINNFENLPEIIIQSLVDNDFWFSKYNQIKINNNKLLFIMNVCDKRIDLKRKKLY